MAQIKEIIENERDNRDKIYLYREGLFYKAYERSAYLWVHKVCGYAVKCRYVKSVKMPVVSIGFPQNALPAKIQGLTPTEFQGGVVIKPGGMVEDEDFDRWKQGCEPEPQSAYVPSLPERVVCQEPTPHYGYNEVIEELRRFPIETSTPLDCVMFISRLKKMI